jgi:Flp pilus assembly protein TadG
VFSGFEKCDLMNSKNTKNLRRGIVIPMVAILLIPLLAMMAFSIDIGYAVEVRAELYNATDAASLAGVQQLYTPYRQWLMASGSARTALFNNAITNAKATVTAVANSNKAGGASVQLLAADVDVGYTAANGTYYSGNQNAIPNNSFPNTVVVTGRRDNTNLPNSNGEVSLFFGPVLGKSSQALAASATAVAYEGMITSFKSNSGVNGSLLPVAVDMTQWTDFYNNGVSSAYADPNAPSGTAWLQIYPGGTGDSMDGLLSLNGSKAASQTWYSGGPPSAGWIQGGPSSADIAGLLAAGDLPLPTNGSGQTWSSGPGMKSSLLGDFQTLITTPPSVRLLPLFDPNSSGTTGGGNGTYQIDYFVPVILVYADGHGKANMDIAVIPAPGNPITDPTVVMSNVTPMGTSTTPPQYVAPVAGKLTQ